MARVFITGANGHIGAHTTREVLKRGHEVVPFVRKTSDQRGLEGLNLDYHYGDIMDPASVEAAVAGCDTVIHLAAVYKVWDSDDRAILDPALIGVRNVFEAGQKAGVRRLIYVSSAASICARPRTGTTKPRMPTTSAKRTASVKPGSWPSPAGFRCCPSARRLCSARWTTG